MLSLTEVQLESLAFLARCPQLAQLRVSYVAAKLTPGKDRQYVLGLPQLRHLHVDEVAPCLFTVAEATALKVSSALFPLLRCFRYRACPAHEPFVQIESGEHHACGSGKDGVGCCLATE